jgi:hypothetical protein
MIIQIAVRLTRRGSVVGDALEGDLIGRVPRIEVCLEGKTCCAGKRFAIALVGTLRSAIQPAQNVDGRRMDLAVNDDVARSWYVWHSAIRAINRLR